MTVQVAATTPGLEKADTVNDVGVPPDPDPAATVTVTCPSPGVTTTVGEAGLVGSGAAGVTALDLVGEEEPAALIAITSKVYDVPFVSPETVQLP